MKKLGILCISFAAGLFFISCKDDKGTEPVLGAVMEQSVDIRITNPSGDDLLDPANSNPIKEFKVYHVINGGQKLFHQANLDAPDGYWIKKNEKENYYYLQVLLSSPQTNDPEGQAKTYIKIGNNQLDTIKASYLSISPSIKLNKIWFNSALSWDAKSNTHTVFTVLK